MQRQSADSVGKFGGLFAAILYFNIALGICFLLNSKLSIFQKTLLGMHILVKQYTSKTKNLSDLSRWGKSYT